MSDNREVIRREYGMSINTPAMNPTTDMTDYTTKQQRLSKTVVPFFTPIQVQ